MKSLKEAVKRKLLILSGFAFDPIDRSWKMPPAKTVGAIGLVATQVLPTFGLTAVAHSSGGLIITGAAGYVSGTFLAGLGFLSLISWPIVFVLILAFGFRGFLISILDRVLVKLYFWRNPSSDENHNK